MPLIIEVAAALVRDEAGRYLITQRRSGSHLAGLWEFPGGKIETGESPEAALRRELARAHGGELVFCAREYPWARQRLHSSDGFRSDSAALTS